MNKVKPPLALQSILSIRFNALIFNWSVYHLGHIGPIKRF
jgi:hypothetical protein